MINLFLRNTIYRNILCWEKMIDSGNRKITSYKETLTHAEVYNGLLAPRCHLQTTNIQPAGNYVNSSEGYHLIFQVAHKQLQSYSYMYVRGADSSYEIKKTVSCFLDSQKVFWNMPCDMEDMDVEKWGNYTQCLGSTKS